MNKGGGKLVSVIVPAYNAQHYIGRTLTSALNQSYNNTEIIVVDDGSIDETASVVEHFCTLDSRVKLIRQQNSGVASARNSAIRASNGTFIAPLDADDLWHPLKLQRQMEVLSQGGGDAGLVYTLYRTIDAEDLVVSTSTRFPHKGWVFARHLNENFIGNGSSLLVPRDVLDDIGGYSSSLRCQGAEGCEDFFLQLSIAAKHRFEVVPEFLVGYRRFPGNMSSNRVRMLLSRRLVLLSFLERCSTVVRPVLLDAINRNDYEIVRIGANSGKYGAVARTLARTLTSSPVQFMNILKNISSVLARRTSRKSGIAEFSGTVAKRKPYSDYSQIDPDLRSLDGSNENTKSALADLDSELGPRGGYLDRPREMGHLRQGI
jgi:glycosyltransferase involved in cell wall biosynthesis